MTTQTLQLRQAAQRFLDQPSIAVVGLSRGKDDTAKTIYDKLQQCGHRVYAIHPTEDRVKGIDCYRTLNDAPEPVAAAVVITQPKHIPEIIEQARRSGTQWLWLHKSLGNSVNPQAVSVGRQQGLNIIDGACPMMFLEPVDGGHKCMRLLMSWTGRIPKTIPLTAIE